MVACVVMALGASDTAAALTLTPVSPSRVVALGEDRTAVVTLVFTASEAVPPSTTVVATPVSLATTEGLQFRAAPIWPRARVANDRLGINVRVALDADQSLEPGRYEGIVAVRAGAGVSAQATLAAVVTDAPKEGLAPWLVAAGALLLGALAGALLKWLTETASKLNAVANRLAQIDVTLADVEGFVPAMFLSLLTEIRIRLAQQDATGAETAVNTITGDNLQRMHAVSRTAKQLVADVEGQRATMESSAFTPEFKARLEPILKTEARAIDTVLQLGWPDPARADFASIRNGITAFRSFLTWASTTSADLTSVDVRTILDLFADGNWTEAATKLKELIAAHPTLTGDDLEQLSGEQLPVRPGNGQEREGRSATRWLYRHYLALSQLIVMLAVVLTGLLFFFDADTTFAGGWEEDFLKLVAYGFGAQATGVTVAQLGAKLGSVGPRIA